MYLSNINDPKLHALAESILLRVGHIFQVQDDFLDAYGDPRITGKIGTDIEDGKCSWLVVRALELANSKQRAILVEHYGRKNEESVAQVKSVYNELQLAQVFRDYEAEEFCAIKEMIGKLDDTVLPKDPFFTILAMIYKRNK